jgi:hypothetical protein
MNLTVNAETFENGGLKDSLRSPPTAATSPAARSYEQSNHVKG